MKDKIKREREEDWAKAKNFIPKLNEVIIYDCRDGIKFKIGDGKTKVNDLDFANTDTVIFTVSDENFELEEEIK